MLFAKKLGEFRSLRRKAVRVIAYKDNSRVETIREQEGAKGYATGFEGLIGYINALLPSNEVIEKALRKTVPMYPELAVSELVVNAVFSGPPTLDQDGQGRPDPGLLPSCLSYVRKQRSTLRTALFANDSALSRRIWRPLPDSSRRPWMRERLSLMMWVPLRSS